MSIFLINSGDSDPFAAILNNGKKDVSFASDFSGNSGLRNKKPDKLIHCVKSLSHKDEFKKIEAIAVTIGPGSFTGIRVGLSIAKGMAFALGVKLIPIDNFALALNRISKIEPEKEYCILLPAKPPEYYFSLVKTNKNISSGCMFMENLDEIIKKDTIIVGDFDDESELKHHYFGYLNLKNSKSELESMCELAEQFFSKGIFTDPDKTEPLYLKDFTMKKPARN